MRPIVIEHVFDYNGLGMPVLIGYHRVTVGRIRAIAASSAASSIQAVLKVDDGMIVVYVLLIGQRKVGAEDDPYELAQRRPSLAAIAP